MKEYESFQSIAIVTEGLTWADAEPRPVNKIEEADGSIFIPWLYYRSAPDDATLHEKQYLKVKKYFIVNFFYNVNIRNVVILLTFENDVRRCFRDITS